MTRFLGFAYNLVNIFLRCCHMLLIGEECWNIISAILMFDGFIFLHAYFDFAMKSGLHMHTLTRRRHANK